MAKHVYYKKSKRLYLPFVGKMDKQERLLKKREQRKRRETCGRLDSSISQYVQHKYASVYAEAKEYHDHLNSMYPAKHDLKKTFEYIAWKKQVQKHPHQSSSQSTVNKKHMELKIQLMGCKKTTTTERTETSSISNEITPSTTERTETSSISNGITPSINEGIITELNEITPSINEEIITELNEITPSIYEEISPQLVEEIMTELKANNYLNDILTEDDFEMFDCNINGQYTLEEEPL